MSLVGRRLSNALTADIEVPTLDRRRSEAMLELLVTQGHNVACVGPTGTGKTLTVVAKLGRGLPDKYIADFMCFSARTSANQTQVVPPLPGTGPSAGPSSR